MCALAYVLRKLETTPTYEIGPLYKTTFTLHFSLAKYVIPPFHSPSGITSGPQNRRLLTLYLSLRDVFRQNFAISPLPPFRSVLGEVHQSFFKDARREIEDIYLRFFWHFGMPTNSIVLLESCKNTGY